MSRVGNIGIDDLPPRPAPDRGRIIRNRKRRPLHPEEIQRCLRERANAIVEARGPTPYGWLIILYTDSGRIIRHTSADATYADARTLLESERSWAGDCGAWIVAKRVPHQRTVLP